MVQHEQTPDPVSPGRVVNATRAKRRFPHQFRTLVPALERSDHQADRAIDELTRDDARSAHARIARALDNPRGALPALEELIESARTLPDWVDLAELERAGEVFFRAGILGGISLGMRSLVYGYAAPVGNKPLAFSGALERKAQRRLAETGKFVSAVCTAGFMHPGAEGHDSTLHVRLMHAQVRRLALSSTDWDRSAWGLPINQHDMLATILLFSTVFLDGIDRFGIDVSQAEAEKYWALWRYVGYVIGVEESLLPESLQEARTTADFIRLTQGPPDADSRALVRALLDEPLRQAHSESELRRARRQVAFIEGVCRELLDPETADGLGLRTTWASRAMPRVRATFGVLGKVRRHIAPLDRWVNAMGARYWAYSVRRGLKGGGILYPLPTALEGRPRARKMPPQTSAEPAKTSS